MATTYTIRIDDQDRAECPDDPWTLTVAANGRHDASESITGANVPAMLRELADQWDQRRRDEDEGRIA